MARSGQIREKKGDKLIKVRLSQHPVETKSRIHLLDSILEFVTVALPNNSMYGENMSELLKTTLYISSITRNRPFFTRIFPVQNCDL